MSTATPNYTLVEAVTEAVNALKVNGKFSAHDVTVAVRESVNEGEYALPSYKNSDVNSDIKYLVNHSDVKAALEAIQNDGTLTNLGLIDIDYSGQYRVYNFDNASIVPSTSTPDVNNDASTDYDDSDDVVDSDGPVAKKIDNYLNNHRGMAATVRQIHSALKINGLTSKDLVELLTNLGYDVEVGTENAYSTYTVH